MTETTTIETNKEAIVDETAVSVEDSPPLTSSLFSRKSATSAQEAEYLRLATLLRWTRFGISILNTGIATAIVGCAGHVLFSYDQTHRGVADYLQLWPANVDIKPTLTSLVPAVIVMIASLAYILYAAIPSPFSRTFFQVVLFFISSSTAFITTLFSVIYRQLLMYSIDTDSRETLQTWTCKFYFGAKDFQKNATSLGIDLSGSPLVPVGFSRLCKESMTGQWMMVSLLVFETLSVGVAVWGLVAASNIKKSRNARYQEPKSESEFE